MKKLKIGLVLGGGGARGLAHIGVIKGLVRHGIPIHCVSGASMGAIVGAAYALFGDIHKVESVFKDFFTGEKYRALKGDSVDLSSVEEPEDFFHFIAQVVKRRIVINMAVNRRGLISSDRLETAIKYLIPNVKIEEMSIPFACTALNLVSGKEYLFKKGKLHTALLASASIPGYLAPVKENNFEWVDGAAINNFPVEVCKQMGAQFNIVCDVSAGLEEAKNFKNVIEVFIRTHKAAVHKLNEKLLEKADFVLKPPIGDKKWTEFEKIDFFIQQGELAVEQNIKLLKKELKKRSGWFYNLKRKYLH
ncbi:Patatin [Caldithrix abyssi DSM 13497]|uniref:NTE family protein n=1 Tax=Caldithrix abyssi DSM 13497 TaxID=880073 RepID=H1XY62_CALAY|nr:patatin-like phospholipase family protein [Caldithrix abyssi]APF17934.1 NTE family protein [Caldithrix abyssi DSM 13497]EHO41989.1 Patatin [Caldithrix abyssi DSM 13497]